MEDLRAEVHKELTGETETALDQRHAGPVPSEPDVARTRAKTFAEDLGAQGSEAAPTPRLRALLQYAERLSVAPADVEAEHLDDLRQHGLDDRALHDAVQVVSYFSYINRIADGLGVDPEPDW
mgnify:CR=1 FL=1